MMGPKASLPLYQHVSKDRPRFSRRRNSHNARGSRRQSGSCGARCWWFAIISPLVLFVFCAGILMGVELAQIPSDLPGSGEGTNGASLPKLDHPEEGGWRQNQKDDPLPGPPLKAGNLRPVAPPVSEDPLPGANHKDAPYREAHENVGPAPAFVVSGAKDDSAEAKWLNGHSFHSREGAYVTVKESLDQSEEVTAAAWIYVDDKEQTADIKTILGNKMSGCGSDALGFALYVNEWEKDDGKLWLEWGDAISGCNKIKSATQVPKGQWVHVAAVMGHEMFTIYIGGEIADTHNGNRRPGSREEFTIGSFADSSFPFRGRIGAVTVFASALTGEKVKELADESGTKPLAEAVNCDSFTDANHGPLVLALQLDESVSGEKDALEAKPVGSDDKKLGGTYHFEDLPSTPTIDDDLKNGVSTTKVTQEMMDESDKLGRERAKDVKAAMQHAWKGYSQYAWGADELAPRSKRSKQSWGSMGVTLVDSLDTLWLMGMKDEFWKARDWVESDLSFENARDVSVFETTIRELGGLLSAYDLSKDEDPVRAEIFKTKAKDLGDKLLPAFDTQSGIPTGQVNFKTGKNSGNRAVLAELGTLQVEFRYLSEITGIDTYRVKANNVFDKMSKIKVKDGLYPIYVSPSSGHSIGSQVTFGALGDSFYEYLLKVWLQGGKTETLYRDMYDAAMDGMTTVLLKKSKPSSLLYVSDWNGHDNDDKMDHLVCFVAGTLALGAQTSDDPVRAERDMKTAKALGYTCYQMYRRQKTGLAPEMVRFKDGHDMVVPRNTAYNILRPETAEALFVLHQITKDPIYRDWSWEIFQAFEHHCKLPVAYGSFPDVNNPRAQPEDRMESFFLAETLKYLYLIQDPDHQMDLSKYVFNTEAHPTRMFSQK